MRHKRVFLSLFISKKHNNFSNFDSEIVMIGSILSALIISGIFLSLFMVYFLEYVTARYDLSEEQVTHILKDLPSFLENLLISGSGVEGFVKKASVPSSLLMVFISATGPVILIGNIYLALSDSEFILGFTLLLILLGYFGVVLRFFQALRKAQ